MVIGIGLILIVSLMYLFGFFQKKIKVSEIILELSPSLKSDSNDLLNEVQTICHENNYLSFNNSKLLPKLKVGIYPQDDKSSILIILSLLDSSEDEESFEVYEKISLADESIDKKSFQNALNTAIKSLYDLKFNNNLMNDELEIVKKYNAHENTDKVQVLNAINALGIKQNKETEELFISMLKQTKDLSVGVSLVKALGNLKSQKSMEQIIEFTRAAPSFIKKVAIDAARKIGSKLSLEWLYVMSHGYSDADVREYAKKAYIEVEKRINPKSVAY